MNHLSNLHPLPKTLRQYRAGEPRRDHPEPTSAEVARSRPHLPNLQEPVVYIWFDPSKQWRTISGVIFPHTPAAWLHTMGHVWPRAQTVWAAEVTAGSEGSASPPCSSLRPARHSDHYCKAALSTLRQILQFHGVSEFRRLSALLKGQKLFI